MSLETKRDWTCTPEEHAKAWSVHEEAIAPFMNLFRQINRDLGICLENERQAGEMLDEVRDHIRMERSFVERV